MSWVKPSHIAELVEVAPATVTRWCHRDDSPLPHVQVRNVIRINETDFWEWWQRRYLKPGVKKLIDFKVG